MLTVHRGTRSCNSCRSQLLLLFEHGFSGSAPLGQLARTRRFPPPSRRLYSQRSLHRTFSTTRSQLDKVPEGEAAAISNEKIGDIEEVVRNARATFGDTLPKDFLSTEEYLLYERLYGPPVRETRADDFGPLNEDGTEVLEDDNEKGTNVLLRENAQGEFEEV